MNTSLNMNFCYSLTKLEVGTKLEVRTKVKVGTKLKVCLVITFVENKNQTRFAFNWGRGQFNVSWIFVTGLFLLFFLSFLFLLLFFCYFLSFLFLLLFCYFMFLLFLLCSFLFCSFCFCSVFVFTPFLPVFLGAKAPLQIARGSQSVSESVSGQKVSIL